MHEPKKQQAVVDNVSNANAPASTGLSVNAVPIFPSKQAGTVARGSSMISPIQKKAQDNDDEATLKEYNDLPYAQMNTGKEVLQEQKENTAPAIPFKPKPASTNRTGLPDNLKSGVEQLSGYRMDDVKVHYNSEKPAQLKAFAYAQGTDIHIGPGHEQHLPHEAWHVVQQKQARVHATARVDHVPINDEKALETEATLMGNTALTTNGPLKAEENTANASGSNALVLQPIVQRAVGFEFEDGNWTSFAVQTGKKFRKPFGVENYLPLKYDTAPAPVTNDKSPGTNIYAREESSHINQHLGAYNLETAAKKGEIHTGKNYKIEPDGPYESGRMDIEFVTKPFEETESGYNELIIALGDMMSVVSRLDAFTGRSYENGSFVEPAEHKFTDNEIYLSGGKPGGGFKVQATQGLPLSKISQLMKILGSDVPGEKKDEKEVRDPYRELVRGKADSSTIDSKIVGSAPSIADKAIKGLLERNVIKNNEGVFNDQPSDTGALHGFISLMVMYMQMMTYVGSQGIKEKLPLMSRYSFASLFKQVPEKQQQSIQENSDAFLLAVETSLAGTRADKMSDPMLSGMMGHTLWDEEHKKQATSMFNALQSITREVWIRAIFAGRDLLSAGDLMNLERDDANPAQKTGVQEYGKSIGVFLRGHGNAARVIDNGRQNLAILENRAITTTDQKEMSIHEAYDFATKYFMMLKLIKDYSSFL